MNISQSFITIAVISLGTIITRFLPFIIFPDKRKPPEFISYLAKVLPTAVIGFLVIYCLRNSFESYFAAPELISILFILVVHKWKHNLLLSVGSATVLYMLLVQNIFVF